MKKTVKCLIAFCIGLLLLGGIGDILLALYYPNSFAINTWVNGIYCTGQDVETVNAQLTAEIPEAETFTIYGSEKEWSISMQELHRSIDYRDALNGYMDAQSSWLWTKERQAKQYQISPAITVNETILNDWCNRITEENYIEEDYRIEYGEDVGYLLFDGLHNRLDTEKAYQCVKEKLYQGETTVDLVAEGCYYDVPMNAQQQENQAVWEKIRYFTEAGPFYDFGNGSEQIDHVAMASFLKKQDMPRLPLTEKNGSLMIDQEAVKSWVQERAAEYDTYQKTWNFKSTQGETVEVEGGTYGSTIDQTAETEWLFMYLQKLAEGKDVEKTTASSPHIPVYTREAFSRSNTDLGDTYIEVDMGNQQLYYYKGGELLLETAIVTGNMKRKMDTPEGVNCVQNKQRNRVLRGPGYATPVKFWMPVKGSIGIHDANWRKKFGEEIYLTNGSHGCVNVPVDMMEKLYDMVEVGTPVIMFYGKEDENQI